MPVEIIGEAGTAGASREWINAECGIAIKHLKRVCVGAPWEYIEKCEAALTEYDTR